MSADVRVLTATELADLFGRDLPCVQLGGDCLNPGAWRGRLGCGCSRVGVLCEEHHAAAAKKEEGKPGHRWKCLDCGERSTIEWSRL